MRTRAPRLTRRTPQERHVDALLELFGQTADRVALESAVRSEGVYYYSTILLQLVQLRDMHDAAFVSVEDQAIGPLDWWFGSLGELKHRTHGQLGTLVGVGSDPARGSFVQHSHRNLVWHLDDKEGAANSDTFEVSQN
jgi:hypothetical protein